MKRSILGLIVGLAVWVLVASLLNRSLRFGLRGYAAAEPQMTFTHAMMAARLALGALASLAAGAVTRASRRRARVCYGCSAQSCSRRSSRYTFSSGRSFQCGIT
jgi:hypothetical protein